jgi:hypothetical protein
MLASPATLNQESLRPIFSAFDSHTCADVRAVADKKAPVLKDALCVAVPA